MRIIHFLSSLLYFKSFLISCFVSNKPITFQRHELTTSIKLLASSSSDINANDSFLSSFYARELIILSTSTEKEATSPNILAKPVKKNKVSKQLKKKEESPKFWKLEDDELIITTKIHNCSSDDDDDGNNDKFLDDNNQSIINSMQFTIRGKPKPLQRHRSSRGFTYNPSAAAQSLFSSVVTSMIDSFMAGNNSTNTTSNNSEEDGIYNIPISPFFQSNEFLNMKLRFRLPRPKYHFRGKSSTVLKPNAPKKYATQMMEKGDIDNLAKFVLDSLNGIIYVDDKQIVSLSCNKVYDFEGDCNGAIDVFVDRVCDEEENKCFPF